MRLRLFPKLLLAFLSVALFSSLLVAVLAQQATQAEVRQFMVAAGMTTEVEFVAQLAAYYQTHGSWAGVETLFASHMGHGGMGGDMPMMRGQRLLVLDTHLRVVADSRNMLVGQTLTNTQGLPILVAGQQVGTLVGEGGLALGTAAAHETVLGRLAQAIWLATLGTLVLALALGSFLAYHLAQPVRALTHATAALAQGHFGQRVRVTTHDEIGELAQSFNHLATQLEQATLTRRALMADIAHELRNPLAVLQSNLEAVVEGVLPPTLENVQPLLVQTHLLTRLVEDLRTLTLAEAGQLALRRTPVAPADLVNTAVAQFTLQAAAKGLRLTAHAAPDLPIIQADAHRLLEVLHNLLANAVRHTPAGGQVTVSVNVEPKQLVFTVADTGPGIPAEALPHLFERFYRAEGAGSAGSAAAAAGRTGLGLAIAKQLVEAHGGRITAHSAPGQGATLRFTVPL